MRAGKQDTKGARAVTAIRLGATPRQAAELVGMTENAVRTALCRRNLRWRGGNLFEVERETGKEIALGAAI